MNPVLPSSSQAGCESPLASPSGLGSGSPSTSPAAAPQMMLLDFFFPGFSVFSAAVQKYLHIDLNLYIPLIAVAGGLMFAWQYFSEYLWGKIETYLMSVVDIRTDDEIYNMLMTWVASQSFARGARRFVVNTNLSSRSWFVYRWEDDDDDDTDEAGDDQLSRQAKKKALAYTPTFGSHWFFYRGRLLVFRRSQSKQSSSFRLPSENEEISISCFGRNPWILKELLHEARAAYIRHDQDKTLIYRGANRVGSTEPTWQRCMARSVRPFSTVILNEKVKQDLIDDVTDYLNPATQRWYSVRGIPWRRGYLLHGPPGTGKSSLSLALAGHFKLRIYIVSLSSVTANEENLASLFAELPRRCVVLLEDIDTAGLTHTRENGPAESIVSAPADDAASMVPGQLTSGDPALAAPPPPSGRLSLSGLLNILDGVASQEGRVLIMTTNHIEKLDKALIRPGRVDRIVKFDKADNEMVAAIFRAIYAPLEGDDAPLPVPGEEKVTDPTQDEKAKLEAAARKRAETVARVEEMAKTFAERIPAHEFSPAELQGFLLKHKRNPDAALESAAEWVVEARKEKKDKELEEAEAKRKAEEKAKEEKEKKEKEEKEKEKKQKEEEEEKEKKKKARESKRKSSKKSSSRRKSSRRTRDESDASDLSGSSSSDSDSEPEPASSSGTENGGSKKGGTKKPKEESTKAPAAATEAFTPPTLQTETSNKTIIAVERLEAGGKDGSPGTDPAEEDGKQQGADSGYGTP